MSKSNGRPLSRIAKALHEQIPGEQERRVYREIAIRGRTAKQLAESMKLPETRIQGMVERVRRWIDQFPVPVDARAMQSQHLARLEHQWHEAMTAWYRSGGKEETIKSSYEDQRKQAAASKDGKRKVERTTRQPCGDVRYLEQARKIMAEYRKLSAEFAAHTKQEQRDANPFSLAQVDAEVAEAIAEIRERNREGKDS